MSSQNRVFAICEYYIINIFVLLQLLPNELQSFHEDEGTSTFKPCNDRQREEATAKFRRSYRNRKK